MVSWRIIPIMLIVGFAFGLFYMGIAGANHSDYETPPTVFNLTNQTVYIDADPDMTIRIVKSKGYPLAPGKAVRLVIGAATPRP